MTCGTSSTLTSKPLPPALNSPSRQLPRHSHQGSGRKQQAPATWQSRPQPLPSEETGQPAAPHLDAADVFELRGGQQEWETWTITFRV